MTREAATKIILHAEPEMLEAFAVFVETANMVVVDNCEEDACHTLEELAKEIRNLK